MTGSSNKSAQAVDPSVAANFMQLKPLEEWELVFVKYLVEGKTSIQAGELTMQRFPKRDLRLAPRTAQRLANKEHIKLALRQSQEMLKQTTTMVEEYQSERVRSLIPTVAAAAIAHLEDGMAGIGEGIQAMRDLIGGEKTAPTVKIGALAQLTNTVKLMMQLSGAMQTEKTLHGQERQTTAQGMSEALYQQIMGNVLVDMEVEVKAAGDAAAITVEPLSENALESV